ncbi:acyl-CoA thioesterase [Desulfovermiculus halophilus]|jgi:acyl-CoA thioester hydrolase|uniref:acyl-CoA thioesterase n=1 Tax=Desulfovermiculus halophilus TaxID=339722 RepID=UPI000480DA86|nr:thioesterase family protein [Desulfovermiculus halophilus]
MRQDTFPSPEIWWPHQVSFGETDAMGVVYYGNYLHWFEQARSHFIRQLGMSYTEIEARGVSLPVREAFCRYRAPARFEDLIRIRTGIGSWGRASLTFHYEVYNTTTNNTFMTSGYTQHACIGPEGKPIPVPDWLKDLILGAQPQG